MYRFVKRILCAGATALAMLGGASAVTADTTEEYVVVGALLGIPFWQDPIAGMKAAEEELGVKVTFIGPAGWNAAEQVAQLQQILVKRPAGLVILPVDPNSVNGIIQQALSRQIPVVTADTDAPDSGRLSFLGTERYGAGVQAADAMIAEMGSAGQVGIFTLGGSLALETSLRGFTDRLKEKAPDIEIVSVIDGKGDPTVITNGLTTMLQGNPGLTGIFTNGTQSSSSVPAAIVRSERNDDIVIVGQGATLSSKDIMQAVQAGTMDASITQRSFQQFYYAIKMLHDLNHQKNSAFGLSWAETGINPLPSFVDTGTMVITPENVSSFYDNLP